MNNDSKVKFVNTSSVEYLKQCDKYSFDIIYLDTCDPNEHGAEIQLEEVRVIVEKNLLKNNGIILIDDVRNPDNEYAINNLDKSKHSIRYLINNGYNDRRHILKKIYHKK